MARGEAAPAPTPVSRKPAARSPSRPAAGDAAEYPLLLTPSHPLSRGAPNFLASWSAPCLPTPAPAGSRATSAAARRQG